MSWSADKQVLERLVEDFPALLTQVNRMDSTRCTPQTLDRLVALRQEIGQYSAIRKSWQDIGLQTLKDKWPYVTELEQAFDEKVVEMSSVLAREFAHAKQVPVADYVLVLCEAYTILYHLVKFFRKDVRLLKHAGIEATIAHYQRKGRAPAIITAPKDPVLYMKRHAESMTRRLGRRDVLVRAAPATQQQLADHFASYFRLPVYALEHLPFVTVRCSYADAPAVQQHSLKAGILSGVESFLASLVCIPELIPVLPSRKRKGTPDLYNLENIGAYEAHQYTKGKGVILGIIDTGVDYNHEEVRARFKTDKGKNFVADNDDPMDDNDHGTHVAGITAGKTRGVAPECTLLALKVLNRNGYGNTSDILRAVDYCIGYNKKNQQKISAINMSLGSQESNPIEEEAMYTAYKEGIVIVAAAGNEGYGPSYPASYKGVISVAAVDERNDHADFSNVWKAVDISAPGVNINSSVLHGQYDVFSGTSMATPHITGTVAIAQALKAMDPKVFEDLLKGQAQELGTMFEPDRQWKYGAGLVRVDSIAQELRKSKWNWRAG